jgi:hypothetical protein
MDNLHDIIYEKLFGKPSWLRTTVHKKGATVNTEKNGSFYFNAIELSIYDFIIQAHLSKEMGFKLPINAITDIHKAYDWFVKNNPKAHIFIVDELSTTFKNSPYVFFHNDDEKERRDSQQASKSNTDNKSKIENESSEKKMDFSKDKILEQEDSIVSFSSFKKFISKNFLYVFFGLIFIFSFSSLLTNQIEEKDDQRRRVVEFDKSYYKNGNRISKKEYLANQNKNLFYIFVLLAVFSLSLFFYLKQKKIDLKRKKHLESKIKQMGFSKLNSKPNKVNVSSNTKTKAEAIKKLEEHKELLDLEIITQEEYDKVKDKLKSIIIKDK